MKCLDARFVPEKNAFSFLRLCLAIVVHRRRDWFSFFFNTSAAAHCCINFAQIGLCVFGLRFCGFEPDFGRTAGTPLERALESRSPSFGLSKAGLSGDTRPSLLWVGAG